MSTNALLMAGLVMAASGSALQDASFIERYENTSEWSWLSIVAAWVINFVICLSGGLAVIYIGHKGIIFLKKTLSEVCARDGGSIEK